MKRWFIPWCVPARLFRNGVGRGGYDSEGGDFRRLAPVAAWIGLLLILLAPGMFPPAIDGHWGTGIARAATEGPHMVTDFWGRQVALPKKINRVVTISDGMIEGVMTRLGVSHTIVGLGSHCIPKSWDYTYPSVSGPETTYAGGMNPVTHLNPKFMELPLVSRAGTGINYEAVVALGPDLILLRMGSCSLSSGRDVAKKSMALLSALGIPVVVFQGPNTFDAPHHDTLGREIRLLGQIFNREERAEALARYLDAQVTLVKNRTRDIPEGEEKSILMLGLSPKARSQGGAAHVKGRDTLQTYFLEEVIHARNAYGGTGAWNILNTEQLLSMDPDGIILVTAWGYHPPSELYDAPYYQVLSGMRAVKNRAVAALPWTPCNCEKRLEYPIDLMVMATAAYPHRFADIDLGAWLLDFYQNVYGVDETTAKALRSCQWMDWTLEKEAHEHK
ncbi:MAG: ABC transporter substrate-binding protein [Desulfobacterales bacterium]|nr:ABC transporter substrate-binding protein [Desulfobacterales bacterium]